MSIDVTDGTAAEVERDRVSRIRRPKARVQVVGVYVALIVLWIVLITAVSLLVGWATGIIVGTAMAAAVNLTPTYPLQLAGYTFPGYTALYTVILNIVVAIVLTPVFNAVTTQRPALDETVASDYHA